MTKIGEEELEDIALGAAVLGTGGGGDPHIGKLMAIEAIRKHGSVELLAPSKLKDGDLVIPTAMMGAPTVLVEKIPAGFEIEKVYRRLEEKLKRTAAATMPTEAGGLNSTIPFTLAARLGVPVVDADGMGRAFPEVQMETFSLYGVRATPMAMSDEKGNEVTIEAVSDLFAERISRAVTVVMGGSAIIAVYSMRGREVKQSCIPGTVSLALRLGALIRESREKGKSAVGPIVAESKGRVLFKGKIVDVERRTVGGFARGRSKLDGIEEYKRQKMSINFQNENLIAKVGERVVATVPDLITVLDLDTGIPITTETLRYGYRVVVLGIPCSEKWRTAAGLRVTGPKYFGYDIPYVPVESRR